MQIDLNSDLSEGFGPWSMGDDAAMLNIVISGVVRGNQLEAGRAAA